MEWVLLGGVGSLVATAFAGRSLGRAIRGRHGFIFVALNALVLLIAMAAVAVSQMQNSQVLFGIALGFGFGGLAGLRYGREGLFLAAPTRPSDATQTTRGDDGFTLVESLTASAILLIIAAAVVTTLVATSSWYAKARMRTEASAVANQVMSLILSRNASEIRRPVGGETWPTAVPVMMSWPSAMGTMSVETSLVPVIDPATQLRVTQIVVTVAPQEGVLDPPATVVRYSSGWQEQDQKGIKAKVNVEVQIKSDRSNLSQSGVRVQLLDTANLVETYHAVTDGSGLARFTNVDEGQYFLTSDPRFGTDIRPLYFPERIFPTRIGPRGQATAPTVKYALQVVRHDTPAVLSVGAFQDAGFFNPKFSYGRWDWEIEKPYRPIRSTSGVRAVVYARPVLNVPGTELGIAGAGKTYPEESALGPYSAEVNDYGVAKIVVPWTVNTSLHQYWTVWCTLIDRTTGDRKTYFIPGGDRASGTWGVPINQIDLMDQGQRSALPQFTGFANADPDVQAGSQQLNGP